MNTRDLTYFCKIYERKSINQAAKDMYITAQGLSKIIKNLEAECGTPLFFRTKNGVITTEAGELLYERSKKLLSDLNEVQLELAQYARREFYLRIGFSCGVLHLFPPHFLQSFAESMDGINIYFEETLPSVIQEKLKSREIDVGLMIGEPENDDYVVIPMTQKKLGIIAFEGHRFYHRAQISINELRDEPIVVLNEQFYCYNALVSNCVAHGFEPRIIAKTMENQIIVEYCKSKTAIGFAVEFSLYTFNQQQLKFIPLEENIIWPVSLVYRKDANNNIALIESLSHYIASSL